MSQQEIATWIDSIRTCVQALHRLLSGLEVSRLHDAPGMHAVRLERVHLEFGKLRRLVEGVPEGELNSDAMTGALTAKSIVRQADILGVQGRALTDYIKSIEPQRLEDILSLLSGVPRPQPLTSPAASATEAARPIPRGSLDEQAVIELKRNPAATLKQLAAALNCRYGTLRDKKKCPMLAKARAILKAQREAYLEGATWRDRRPDDDEA